jgi:TonB family protein
LSVGRCLAALICVLQAGLTLAQTAPVLLSKIDLENCSSSFASATRVEGTTALSAVIDPSGQATDVVVTASAGFQSLDEAAVDCFKKARFQPATSDGKPVQAPYHYNVKWLIYPGAESCSPSMPRGWIAVVSVDPANTGLAPPAPNTEADVCSCLDGTEPRIVRSSGTARFDEGALKLMKKTIEQHPITTRMAWCYAGTFRFVPKTAAVSH